MFATKIKAWTQSPRSRVTGPNARLAHRAGISIGQSNNVDYSLDQWESLRFQKLFGSTRFTWKIRLTLKAGIFAEKSWRPMDVVVQDCVAEEQEPAWPGQCLRGQRLCENWRVCFCILKKISYIHQSCLYLDTLYRLIETSEFLITRCTYLVFLELSDTFCGLHQQMTFFNSKCCLNQIFELWGYITGEMML